MNTTPPDSSETKETPATFHRFFNAESSALQQQITRLGDTSIVGGERADAIEHCLAGIARLSDAVKDAATYLPGYDQRVYSEQIKALSTHLTTTRTSVAPKAKFSFKRKQAFERTISKTDDEPQSNGTSTLPNSYASSIDAEGRARNNTTAEGPWGHGEGAVATPDSTDEDRDVQQEEQVEYQDLVWGVHPVSITPGQPLSITRLQKAHVVLRPATSLSTTTKNNSSTTGTLSHLSHTLIDLFGSTSPPSTQKPHAYTSLTLTNINASIIITGPIAGPIHITNVTNSLLLVSQTRQFRMHHSKNVDVHLNVLSRPVIENCNDIRFAPLPRGFLRDWMVDEKGGEGMWDQVQDFNWLRAEQSPHWRVMEEMERERVDWRRLREDGGDGEGWKEMIGRLEAREP